MSKKLEIFLLGLILLLALVLRVYKITEVPPAIDWDETALGYNAYSILKTGRDEYGSFLPLSFRSFNDYKPPLSVYFLVPFVAFFGLNEFSIRFPSALIGVSTVFVAYFLTKTLARKFFNNPSLSTLHSLLTTLFLAISPWHLQFSRVAFEPNLALFLIVTGIYFLLKAKVKIHFFWPAALFLSLSFYTYHSARIFAPFLLFGFFLIFKNDFLKNKKKCFFPGLFFVFLSLPVFLSLFSISGQARLKNTTFFNHPAIIEKINTLRGEDNKIWAQLFHNKIAFYPGQFLKNYLTHFSAEFLFNGALLNYRLNIGNQGQLYLFDLPFILIGIYFLINERLKEGAFLLFWLLISPLPASIGTEVPHPLRMLVVLPSFQIISAYGLIKFLIFLRETLKNYFLLSTFCFPLIALLVLNFSVYLHNYYIHYPLRSSFDWQYGHKEMVNYTEEVKNNFSKIIITTRYFQPHIFFLFYTKADPAFYQKNGLPNFEFRRINWSEDKNLRNTLLVGTADEIPEGSWTAKKIYFLDKNPAFIIAKL